jgi:hypothetical protein
VRHSFGTPGRRDRRFNRFVALSVAQSKWPGGYTAAEHDAALDRLLADLDLPDTPAPTPRGEADEPASAEPDITVFPRLRREDDSRLFLTAGC